MRELGSCRTVGSEPDCALVKHTGTPTPHMDTQIYAAYSTHTESSSHVHTAAGMSQFFDRLTESLLALHPHNCATQYPSASSVSVT